MIIGNDIAGADGADPKELAQYRDAICLMIKVYCTITHTLSNVMT